MKNKTKTARIAIALLLLTAILYSCKTNQLSQKRPYNLNGNYDTVFFDENWNECQRSQANYYRLIEKAGTNFIVKDMYLDDQPQMIAVCSSVDPLVKNGKCTYYEPCRIKSSEGNYRNDKKTGKWIMWEDGGKDSAIVSYKQDGTRIWIRMSKEMREKTENGIITMADEMPAYPGGDKARLNFLQNNITYPVNARSMGIQGTVYVTFVVETDGSISDVRVLRGIGGGCDEEAIRVIKKMPKWKPGRMDGKLVRVQFNMPIKFTLTGKSKKRKSKYFFF